MPSLSALLSGCAQPAHDLAGIGVVLDVHGDTSFEHTSDSDHPPTHADGDPADDGSCSYINGSLSFVEDVPATRNGTNRRPSRTEHHHDQDTSRSMMELDSMGRAHSPRTARVALATSPVTEQEADAQAGFQDSRRVGVLSLAFHIFVLVEIFLYLTILVGLGVLWDGRWTDFWFVAAAFRAHISQFVTGTCPLLLSVQLGVHVFSNCSCMLLQFSAFPRGHFSLSFG